MALASRATKRQRHRRDKHLFNVMPLLQMLTYQLN